MLNVSLPRDRNTGQSWDGGALPPHRDYILADNTRGSSWAPPTTTNSHTRTSNTPRLPRYNLIIPLRVTTRPCDGPTVVWAGSTAVASDSTTGTLHARVLNSCFKRLELVTDAEPGAAYFFDAALWHGVEPMLPERTLTTRANAPIGDSAFRFRASLVLHVCTPDFDDAYIISGDSVK